MKIIGFAQLRNELSKGNLVNWFGQMQLCDYIYIFDQNSDDGSLEFYENYKNVTVIKSSTNRFKEELICKNELLTKLLTDHPDVDWILWMDGDLLLDGRLLANNGEVFYQLCEAGMKHKVDGYLFSHYNLWRSDIYYRIDDLYHSLDGAWCPLWRNNGNLHFNNTVGLHQRQYPSSLKNLHSTPYAVVHRGFATDYQIMLKYDIYKANGQHGWELERLLDEYSLNVCRLDDELLPDFFVKSDEENPMYKRRLRMIYNEKSTNNGN